MENKGIYRNALLNNVTKMCKYIEDELDIAVTDFRISYESGFINGWKEDCIGFYYDTKKRTAKFYIQHYPGNSVWVENGKVFDVIDGECTNSFFANYNWYKMHELEKAIEITQNKWNEIKSAVSDHKKKEYNVFNFKV